MLNRKKFSYSKHHLFIRPQNISQTTDALHIFAYSLQMSSSLFLTSVSQSVSQRCPPDCFPQMHSRLLTKSYLTFLLHGKKFPCSKHQRFIRPKNISRTVRERTRQDCWSQTSHTRLPTDILQTHSLMYFPICFPQVSSTLISHSFPPNVSAKTGGLRCLPDCFSRISADSFSQVFKWELSSSFSSLVCSKLLPIDMFQMFPKADLQTASHG